MSSLESALRSALAKGDIESPIFRRRIYEAAAKAMHKSLDVKGNATPEAVKQQNLRLADVIKKLEAEIKHGAEPVTAAPVEPATQPNPIPAPIQEPRFEPAPEQTFPAEEIVRAESNAPYVSAPEDHVLAAEPRIVAKPRRQEREVAPDNELTEMQPPKKRPFASLLTASIAVALLGIGLLWVITTGAFQSAEERDTSVPNPARVLESESFEGRDPGTATAPETRTERTGSADGWVVLFTPEDPTTLSLVDGATAEISSDPFGDYAQIATPNEVAQVQIDVPLSVLRNSGGNPLQLSLTARSEEGAPTQMSVTCDFGPVGDCGRHRFNVGQAENEFLIQLDLANAQTATAAGRISLVTDVQGEGRSIKLLSARVRNVE